MKRMLQMALVLLALLVLPLPASAKEVTDAGLVTDSPGFSSRTQLFDTYTTTPVTFSDQAQLTLSCPEGIGSLYLIFDIEYGAFTVTDLDSGETRVFGENRFLHEFVDLQQAFGTELTNLKIRFDNGPGSLNELRVFTSGSLPEDVQIWEAPKDGETDIVLFSSHGDDEQLFFAGLLPDYAAERGYQVQVVYLTNHRNMTNVRCHEMLDGLWAVGIKSYPVFGTFPDLFTKSASQTRQLFQGRGIWDAEVLGFVVEQLRRFKPMVAIGHDLQGEYGHGQHMYYAEVLTRAVEISQDSAQFPESAEKYGAWDVPKTYLHLYPENTITLDWDRPLEAFGGMTAFEVTKQLGYPCHKSQYWDFAWYLSYAESAAAIANYSPCSYGLYRSTVGADVQRNDFMENLISHAQRKAEEEQARLEAERKAAEEKARQEADRLEAERKAEEEQKRQEQIRLEKEQQLLALQQEAASAQQQRRRDLLIWGFAGALTVLVLLGVLISRLDARK